MVDVQRVQDPVVQRAVVLELHGAQRVRDPLDGVRLAVGEVVHRVDAPRVPCLVVRRVQDPVQHRVPHVQVPRRHVDLRPQHPRPLLEVPRAHAPEQVQVLLHRAGAVGALLSRPRQRAPLRADLLRAEVVHVRPPLLNQINGEPVQLLEVVGCKVEVLAPVPAQPAHVLLDGFDVHVLFLRRVRIVESKVALAAPLRGDSEVEADRLGVPDV